jgi:hypothetical protein
LTLIERNVLYSNYNGYPFAADLKQLPKLSRDVEQTIARLEITAPLPHNLDLSKNLHTFFTSRPDPDEFDLLPAAGKSLVSIALLTILITSIAFLCSLPSGFFVISFICAFWWVPYGCLSLYSLLASSSVTELENQEEALGKEPVNECPRLLLIMLCHILIPLTPVIEIFYHKHRWGKIRQIQQEDITQELIDQMKYWTTHFHDLDQAITNQIDKPQDTVTSKGLKKAQQEVRSIHAFYTHTLEPMRKKLAEEIDATSIFPPVLSPVIAGYV